MSATFASGAAMRRLAVALLTAGIPLFVSAQSGEWGSRGNSRHFVARGNLLFAADGRGVAVYDVSQPTVRRVAAVETEAESVDLALIGDGDLAVATRTAVERFAVAADGSLTRTGVDATEVASRIASNGIDLAGITSDGITIWDASTHTAVAGFFLSPPPVALAWHGATLLAAEPGIGVTLYDVGAVQPPITLTEDAQDIAVSGDMLAIAAGPDGLVTYDLSDPTPRLLARTGGGAVNFATVAATATRAFVTEQPDTVHVFDLTSGTPVLASTFSEPAEVIAASGMRLFISGVLYDSFGPAGYTGAPLRIFDASDASTPPQRAGEFRDLAGPVSGVATDGTLAYVADPPFFRIIDVSKTAAPRELASLQVDGFGGRVRVKGDRAIVFGRGEVQMIDVSNPYAPALMKIFHTSGGPPSNAAFARNTVVEGNPYSGFHVVDFDDFPQPGQIGGLKGHYFDVDAEGDFAWILLMGGLQAVDLSDPRNPRVASTIAISGVREEIASATPRHPELLMVVSPDGIHLLSIANPLSPIQTSFLPLSAASAIAADGDQAFAAGAGAVQALDLTSPALQATTMQAVAPMDIAAANGKVVIADRYSLRIDGPDTAPPPSPRRRPSRK